MKNQLKAMLKDGKFALGTTLTIGHPDVAELIGRLGYDWILIDTEHAPLEPAMVQVMLQAMSASMSVPLVRVPWNDMVLMKRVLDVGAHGLVVPWVNTKEEAEKAVKGIRYPPDGLRGFGPRRAGALDPDYVKTANQELLLGIQIETERAVNNIDEILGVPGIDAALVGPADLSMSMGIHMQFSDPRFSSAMDRIAKACAEHGVVAGMLAVDDVEKRAKQGYKLLNVAGDYRHLMAGGKASLAESRKAAEDALKARSQAAANSS